MTLTNVESIAVAAAVGMLAGTHTAIWGMYKDAIHEGFELRRFARSVCVGALAAVAIQMMLHLPLPHASALAVLFGLAYAAERGIVEVWKTFVRIEDQTKYSIPMQFSLRGIPVASGRIRLAAGAGYVIVVALCLWSISGWHRGASALPSTMRTALVGLVVGAIIAFGGAWKDAPTEGFDGRKFFRSPIMTVAFALLLAQMTDSYLQVAVAAIGYERASAETYKTFFFPSKPRGKFAGKPVHFPAMLRSRRYFVPVYIGIWAWVLTIGALALRADARRPSCSVSDRTEACS